MKYVLNDACLKSFTRLCASSLCIVLTLSLANSSARLNEKNILEQSHLAEKNAAKEDLHAFETILLQAEGFEHSFYKDNKGVAIAYGWNIHKSATSFNTQMAKEIGLKEQEVNKILLAAKDPKQDTALARLTGIKISRQSAKKASQFLMSYYTKEFCEVWQNKQKNLNCEQALKSYSPHQKAVFAHMAYKLGRTGLSNFTSFFSHLSAASHLTQNKKDPTPALQAAANEIGYVYWSKGEKRRDQKVQDLHRHKLLKI